MGARKVLRWSGFFLLFFGVSLGVALGAVAVAYHGRFYPGVRVAGISLAGKTQAEGRQILARQAATYEKRAVVLAVADVSQPKDGVSGRFPDKNLETTMGSLGLSVEDRAAADSAWVVGRQTNPLSWLREVVPTLISGTEIGFSYEFSQPTAETYVAEQIVPGIPGPKAATLAVADGVASVVPAQPGLQIDSSQLADSLALALRQTPAGEPVRLRLPAAETNPTVQASQVQPLADRLNAIGTTRVSLTGTGLAAQRPNRAQIVSWFGAVQDEQGQLSLVPQKDSVSAYLSSLASVDASKSLDGVVTALADMASQNLRTSLTIVVKPKTGDQGRAETTAGSYTLNRFPGKYVEVNLAEQKLYQIEGGTLLHTFLVSSGKASTPTPRGQFYIGNKAPRAFSGLYHLYMPWWESFLDNKYGLHELPEWPGGYKEGEGHLGIPVSDGCVRLGIGAAKEMYDWTETGTPVYIH